MVLSLDLRERIVEAYRNGEGSSAPRVEVRRLLRRANATALARAGHQVGPTPSGGLPNSPATPAERQAVRQVL